jgi:hypothetical protein
MVEFANGAGGTPDAATPVPAAGGGIIEEGDPAGGDAYPPLAPSEPFAVPFCSMASCRNFAWDFSSVGLMLKVIPIPQ